MPQYLLKIFSLFLLAFLGLTPPCEADWLKVKDIPSPYSEDIVLGETIREIRLVGNETTRDHIILASMASKVGKVYTRASADIDSKRLYGLGVFQSVRFSTIELEDMEDGVILVVTMEEVNAYIPAPSIKITEENGLEIGAALSSANMLGTAARLSAYARVGGATNVGIKFKNPWLPYHPWWLGSARIEYSHMERHNPMFEFDESSDDFFIQAERNITNQLRWGPRFMYLSVGSKQDGITLSPDNRDDLPGLGLSLLYDTRNLFIYPTRGSWSELLVNYVGGSANYWQGNLDLRRYFKIDERNSLALYSLTTLTSGTVGVDIPIYQQFVIGGANTVRGWNLGARSGKNQFLNTVEHWFLWGEPKSYELWFLKQALGFQVAANVDFGTAWTETRGFHGNWILGGGLGLRITIPSIVMVRFDFAFGEEGAGIGLFIGSNEKAEAQRMRVR